MQYSVKHLLASQLTLLSVLGLMILHPQKGHEVQAKKTFVATARVSVVYDAYASKRNSVASPAHYRVAKRLQKRLQKKHIIPPPLPALAQAIQERNELFGKQLSVKLTTEEDPEFASWDVSLHRYPLWIAPRFTFSSASFTLDEDRIRSTMEEHPPVEYSAPEDATLEEVFLENEKLIRAKTDTVGKAGLIFDTETAATEVAQALTNNDKTLTIPLSKRAARITNASGFDLGEMTLLASGKSNFRGSTYARMRNVRKALSEHVNNTVVEPGETFSFNSTLGGPVTTGRGWSMAKVIFNGGDLEYAPGGGICQASTTVYRAIINAGFPILDRKAHSLYVSYYEKYGVGIDATIYPGSQDLTFINDTGNYLLIQSYTNESYDAVVNVYGTSDGRTVELTGPYFANNAPEHLKPHGRPMKLNEIAWIQRVLYSDGFQKENTIVSRYKSMPRSIVAKYAEPSVHMHAAAPNRL
jgi:hypothetical protein